MNVALWEVDDNQYSIVKLVNSYTPVVLGRLRLDRNTNKWLFYANSDLWPAFDPIEIYNSLDAFMWRCLERNICVLSVQSYISEDVFTEEDLSRICKPQQ